MRNILSEGLVSGMTDQRDGPRLIQTTATMGAGSIGAPLLNGRGEVVGVATATVRDGQDLNFAVPVDAVWPLVKQAKERPMPIGGVASAQAPREARCRRA
jgi:S1-C subfamily serine protease